LVLNNLQKIRIFIGIMLSIFLNNHQLQKNNVNKNNEDDYKLFKKLIINHSIQDSDKLAILDKQSISSIILYA
jgi:hypothetical protein